MRIEDCEIHGELGAVTAAFTRSEPEADWLKALDAGILPATVFSLYKRAGFLSYGSSPRFFSDPKQYLFGYFSMALESVKGTLADAAYEAEAFAVAQSEIYDVARNAEASHGTTMPTDEQKTTFGCSSYRCVPA